MGLIRKFFRTFFYMLRRISDRIIRDNITVYSAMATFFLVLSLLPFSMILLSLIRFLLPESMGTILQSILQILPPEMVRFATRFLSELLTADTTSVVSFSALMSLWAASKGIMGLELGMHVIYRNSPRGNYLRRRLRCTLYTLVFVATILIATLMLVFGSAITELLEQNLTFFSKIAILILGVRTSIMIVVFIIVFTLGYRFLTGTQASFWARLPGVLFSTAGWFVFSALYAFYINHFSTYTYLYGSLGALILFFLWLYACMIILLGGAEVNVFLRDWREGTWRFWVDPLTETTREPGESGESGGRTL